MRAGLAGPARPAKPVGLAGRRMYTGFKNGCPCRTAAATRPAPQVSAKKERNGGGAAAAVATAGGDGAAAAI
eukprot:gene13250-biopygen3494